MFFEKGEWYEVSGGTPNEVLHADEDVFVSRVIHFTPGIGMIAINTLKIYSNKEADLKDKYWIKKIPPCEINGNEAYQAL